MQSNFWDAVSQRSALGQRWTPRSRMAGLSGEQDARRSILDTQAISSPTTQQEQAVGASSYPESQGSILSQQPSSGRNIWGLNTVGSPDTGFNYERWANTVGRPVLNYGINSLGQTAVPAAIEATGEGLSTAGLESGAGAYMTGAEAGLEGGTSAAGEVATEAGAELAGASAGGYLALAYILYQGWKHATQGTGRNDPMEQTRDIALGGRDLSRLIQGYEYAPEDVRFGRNVVDTSPGAEANNMVYQNYGPGDIGELYERLHRTSRGGYQGSHIGGLFGWGGSGEPTHITDQDVDNYLYSQGVSRDQLSQAIGYEPPDWSTTTWEEFYPQRLQQVTAEREARIQNNQATDADIAWHSGNMISQSQGDPMVMFSPGNPYYRDYWTALQARDPNLAAQEQAVSIDPNSLMG